MSKKIPISFNENDIANIKKLIKYLGIDRTYGDLPKAVKFSIILALAAIQNPEKVYQDLKLPEMDLYFKSIRNAEISRRSRIIAVKHQERVI